MDADDDDLSARPCPSNKCTMFMPFVTPGLIVIAFKLQLKMNVMSEPFSWQFRVVLVHPLIRALKHMREDTANTPRHIQALRNREEIPEAVHLEP